MSKKAFYHNERRRHHYASPNSDSRNNTNCASLSCDVDARISCGGKTFQSKLIGNNGYRMISLFYLVVILLNSECSPKLFLDGSII